MNYFAHGFPFVDQPYFLAGTALPDWLGVADRRIRLPPNKLIGRVDDEGSDFSQIVHGVLRHHEDDACFHVNPAFSRLCADFRARIQHLGAPLDDHVSGLVAHILVELLLDAALIEDDPSLLDRYYRAVGDVDPARVAMVVQRVSGREASRLVRFIEIFREEEFLRDYLDDERLRYRLGQIVSRIGGACLPAELSGLLPRMRRQVKSERRTLLAT